MSALNNQGTFFNRHTASNVKNQAFLEEGIGRVIRNIDRNILRPKQYEEYMKALQMHRSARNELNSTIPDQEATYLKYKNSPNGKAMEQDLMKNKKALDYHENYLDHLQRYGLRGLKLDPEEMARKRLVNKSRLQGAGAGFLAGAGAAAGIAANLASDDAGNVTESTEIKLQENV